MRPEADRQGVPVVVRHDGHNVPSLCVVGGAWFAEAIRRDAQYAAVFLKDTRRPQGVGVAAELFREIEELRSRVTQPAPRIEEREPDPVFGRDDELRRLDEMLRSASSGSGKVVMVAGEPGIGKTTLARSFVYAARQVNAELVLARGACVEHYGTSEPYLPFLDALGSLLQSPTRERTISVMSSSEIDVTSTRVAPLSSAR